MNRRRLDRIQRRLCERWAEDAGAPYGLTGAEVLDEGRRFLALTDSEQDEELPTLKAELQANGEQAAATVIDDGWQALRRSR
jgi:hypothetical protein